MNKPVSSRRVTFVYFAIVAFAIVAVHIALFQMTLEDIETSYAKNRLNYEYEQNQEKISELNAGKLELDPFLNVYVGREQLPAYIHLPTQLSPGDVFENRDATAMMSDLLGENPELDHFVLYKLDKKSGQEVFLVSLDILYEQSEEEVVTFQSRQFGLSLLLLLLSLLVVMRISTHLTRPLSKLAEEVNRRNTEDFSPLSLPAGATTEVVQVANSFNQRQKQIQTLIERERSFNRYASHELRSPLMVIKGACSLLKQNSGSEFADKQRRRIEEASTEMIDIVSTLLSLTQDEHNEAQSVAREIFPEELNSICRDHEHLLQQCDVSWRVCVAPGTQVAVPETTFKILLGNLVKNAFAHTEYGSVVVELNRARLKVSDTGSGLSATRETEGYGLGLVIVRDICRKYGWNFRLNEVNNGGCVAEVVFMG